MRTSELLMPAGNLQKLKIAVLYGADAIYLGTPDMSLRTKAEFTLEQVVEGIEFAHKHGKRVYLTLNLFSHNKDVPKLKEYAETIRDINPDGLIIADPGVFQFMRKELPNVPLHISTQANVCSWLSVDFWKEQGADLVVLAREVSFPELSEIREKCPDIRLEAFVHGAMCMTYSGRCLLSNFMAERGANQGNCANSCRWNYKVRMRMKDGTINELELNEDNMDMFEFLLEEGCRPGELMPILEDGRGSYILNSKDLCLMPKLNDFLRIGVDSLKIEGRGKSMYYVAVVARAYRMAIDDYYRDPENWNPQKYMDEMYSVANRGYTTAFHEGRLNNYAHNYEDTHSIGEWEFAGIVEKVTDEAFYMKVKNKIVAGEVLEFLQPLSDDSVLLRIYEFENAKSGEITEEVHAGKQPLVRIPFSLFDKDDAVDFKDRFPVNTVVRKERPLTPEQWSRLKLDRTAERIEARGEATNAQQNKYESQRDRLIDAISEGSQDRKPKSPRLGLEGCCGRGCNGCMIFWEDPKFEKAREILKTKKQGVMLARNALKHEVS
ncbi:putative protease YhbU precursor [Pseudovibrio sp. Ad46]|uniref:U32 family peptidase C-terminal domain-containing protein n=1 Tax=Pseudovibrio sp. Ad46 TaxID=989432 RepID=UPI0007AED973|nr:U32 family peptidase C-terminal domain-containing protein [Pseudovibrio sp. Ad46]KZK75734.1 putative protease YhbU precursor [Pseudovibrio sp. Ad46]